MSLLIDGYNLMHAAGILGRGLGPGGLERGRTALLNFLAESIDPAEVGKTIVVFDAASAPPGAPAAMRHKGLLVRFAADYEDADALIEELIRHDAAPKKLTVVSSDHRLHRAARRRRAKAVDSEDWYAETLRLRRQRQCPSPEPQKPLPGAAERSVEYWLHEFENLVDDLEEPSCSPFPPGYAEDEQG
jgi:predicted RNA-binding protein with PIN domain